MYGKCLTAGSGDLSANLSRTAQGTSELAAFHFVLRVNDLGSFFVFSSGISCPFASVFKFQRKARRPFKLSVPHPLCLFPGRRKASTLFRFFPKEKKK